MLVDPNNKDQLLQILKDAKNMGMYADHRDEVCKNDIPEYVKNPSFAPILLFSTDEDGTYEEARFDLSTLELDNVLEAVILGMHVVIEVPQNFSTSQEWFLENIHSHYGLLVNNTTGTIPDVHPFGSVTLEFEECEDPCVDKYFIMSGLNFAQTFISMASKMFDNFAINDPKVLQQAFVATNFLYPRFIPYNQFYMVSGHKGENGRHQLRDCFINYDVGFSADQGLLRLEGLHDGLKFTYLDGKRERMLEESRSMLEDGQKTCERMINSGLVDELDIYFYDLYKSKYKSFYTGGGTSA